MKSYLQAAFERWLERTDLPKREIEYQFHPERQRRFDFAWPNQPPFRCGNRGHQSPLEPATNPSLDPWPAPRITKQP